ncbi:MAG TPA: TIGR01777 family oxidoreductase [Candidatus Methylacidiphilales bacterium]
MKIVLPGGTGHVGTLLARALHRDGHEVVVLSRTPRAATPEAPWRTVAWDGKTVGPWAAEFEGADAVVNLAGRSVNCRYHARNLGEMMASRIDSTRAVREAVARAARPPRVWLQASTATLYAHHLGTEQDAPNGEEGQIGGGEPGAPRLWDASIEIAKAWEREACGDGLLPATRLVLLRTAIVMETAPGGPFAILRNLARLGLGGKLGNGRQYVSWIHGADFVRAVLWLIGNDRIAGVVNVAAPEPLPNAAFMRALRRACGVPLGIGLPAPAWLLEIASFFLRTETELVLKSRRVVPERLLREGFAFRFPAWPGAALDLCRNPQD